MGIKTVTLSRLEARLRKTLNECADSGQTFVIELTESDSGRRPRGTRPRRSGA